MPGLLYLLTLYPGAGGRFNFGDSAKFQFIGEVLGVPHEPGFPQYVVLNWLWTRLPLPGELAGRVTLLSAVLAVVAAVLFFLLAERLTESPAAALLATWAVFLGRRIWAASTDAEVYALNLAWVAGVMLLAWEWQRTRRPGLLTALLFAYALSFGNHPSMIVLLPALAWLVLSTDAALIRQPRWIGIALLAVTVGLSQYGFLLWRAHSDTPYLENLPRNGGIADLLPFMFAQRFSDRWFMGGWGELLFPGIGRVLSEANVQFLLPALLFAVAGGALLWRRERRFTVTLGLATLAYALFAAGYEIPDWEVYCLPAWLLVGWFLAAGLDGALRAQGRQRLVLVSIFAVTLAVAVAFNVAAMRVEPGDEQWALLADVAGRDAVLVTHVERDAYHAIETDNYYRLGLGLGASRGLRFTSAEQVFFDDALYLDDTPLYTADPAVLQMFTDAAVDVVSDSPSGLLADWIAALPPRSIVAVAIDDIGSPALRQEIAGALAPLGLGGSLAGGGSFYVGLGIKGPLRGIEAAGPALARLQLTTTDRRLGDLIPSPPRGFPQQLTLTAEPTDDGVHTVLTADDTTSADARAGMRLFLFEAGGFSTRYVDSGHGAAFEPMYWHTGTRRPIRELTIAPRTAFPPAILREDGSAITRGHPALEASVIGCAERRVKVIRTFDFDSAERGMAQLADFVPRIVAGDWLLIAARGPIPPDDRAALATALVDAGAGDFDVSAAEQSLFFATRVGRADASLGLIDLQEPVRLALQCDDSPPSRRP
ncbi:MAG: DUF2723 domain-containing protein [Acidobacteriota bacterium]